MLPEPADERPHRPTADPGWEESWHFDFAADDGSVGGFVRLTLRPGEGAAWYWAYLAGARRPVVAVRDHELEPPRARALEVRGPGLWAQVTCETPLDHWSAGLEASGVALDDPAEGLRGERGDPIALGLDVEWEATGPPATEDGSGYCQPATVHGEVLVGAERLDLDAVGWWAPRGGPPRWRDESWWWAGGGSPDGTAVAATAPGRGWRWSAGPHDPPEAFDLGVSLSSGGLAGAGSDVALEPVAPVFVPLPGDRALVRTLSVWSLDGGRGWGWVERLQPPAA